jgi:hypothetical protein
MRSAALIIDCDTGVGSAGEVRMHPHRELEQRFNIDATNLGLNPTQGLSSEHTAGAYRLA